MTHSRTSFKWREGQGTGRRMTYRGRRVLLVLPAVLILTGCGNSPSTQTAVSDDRGGLVGAWRSKIVFQSGPLAEMKGLEFLYAYNAGGTMTESSNYDEAANSSPQPTACGSRPAPEHSKRGTCSTRRERQSLGMVQQLVPIGGQPGTACSPRPSRCPTMARRIRQRSSWPRSTGRACQSPETARAREPAPGSCSRRRGHGPTVRAPARL